MTRQDTNPKADTPRWSAHNLPPEKASPMTRLSVLAVAAGLVVFILATAVRNPIHTAGTRMEPTRFTGAPAQPLKANTASTGIVVAADLN